MINQASRMPCEAYKVTKATKYGPLQLNTDEYKLRQIWKVDPFPVQFLISKLDIRSTHLFIVEHRSPTSHATGLARGQWMKVLRVLPNILLPPI